MIMTDGNLKRLFNKYFTIQNLSWKALSLAIAFGGYANAGSWRTLTESRKGSTNFSQNPKWYKFCERFYSVNNFPEIVIRKTFGRFSYLNT